MERLSADQILNVIQETIQEWHYKNENRAVDAVILTEDITKIRELGCHREHIKPIVKELTETNTEMWHEEDKIRSMNDEVVLRAIRNVNPLNQHRNDLIEEIDEIVLDNSSQKEA